MDKIRLFQFIGLFGCIVFFASCSIDTPIPTNTVPLTIYNANSQAEVSVNVELARTQEESKIGLMFRESMPQDQGMLFIYPQEQDLTFWMKNTLIPLDIIFFDTEGNFVSTSTMVPCTQDPCTLYDSMDPALYALEVNKGFVESYNIDSTWKLRLPVL